MCDCEDRIEKIKDILEEFNSMLEFQRLDHLKKETVFKQHKEISRKIRRI
jgi:hypothetical protein